MSPSQTKNMPPPFDPAIVQQHRDGAAQGRYGRPIPDAPLAEHANLTPFPSQYFQSVDQHGEVFHVVVLRVTYDMRQTSPDGSLAYAAEQTPLATRDEWAGGVNVGSPLWESDYAPYKPRCDVLIANAVSRPAHGGASNAWAQAKSAHGEAAVHDSWPQERRWPCGVALKWQQEGQAKSWSKQLMVTGPRHFGLINLGEPEPASEVAIDWRHAYGGQDKRPAADEHAADGSIRKAAGSAHWETDERNPVGAGFNKASGQPGPQLEVFEHPYKAGFGQDDYPPVGLSAMGRAWLPRRLLAGTYDNDWLKDQWPLPPMDFDEAYWNAAPADQQVDYLPPGTGILLMNLHPAGAAPVSHERESWEGRLPMHQLSVQLLLDIQGEDYLQEADMRLDTLVVDLARQQIYAVHRYAVAHSVFRDQPLKKLENWMAPVGRPDETVPLAELGPLARTR